MIRRALSLSALAALTACSSLSGKALDQGGDTTVAAATPSNPTETASALNGKKSFGASTQIPAIVNGEPITKLMVTRRAAFLKLRRAPKSGQTAARDELIEDALKLQEAKRRGVRVPPARINDAYANFAKGNKLSLSQLNKIMNQSGVTPQGFKDYIEAQIAWSSLVAQRGNGGAVPLSESEAIARIQEAGGEKPTATEYFLQQVIFVVPSSKRSNSLIAARTREANQMRAAFNGCDGTVALAAQRKDVTVRDLGRKVGPELPGDWRPFIEKASAGQATKVRTTERGVEYIGICRTRTVSDDRTARLVFASRDAEKTGDKGAAYLAELRKRAKIVTR